MIQVNSQLIYFSWRLGIVGLIAKTLWDFWTKGNWRLSALKTGILASSLLFVQYIALRLEQLH